MKSRVVSNSIQSSGDPPDSRGERGSSLVEILVSMLILLFVLLGVLQLFTMALTMERVSDAKSEMTTKAQNVVEVIRMVSSIGNSGNSGILPLGEGIRALPTTSSDSGYDFWGPAGMGIVEIDARYQLSYQITDGDTDWVVTVFAQPKADGDGGESSYLTPAVRKGVRYAAHVPK